MKHRSPRSTTETHVEVPRTGRRLLWRLLWITIISAALLYGIWPAWLYAHPGLAHYRQGMDYATAHQFKDAESAWQQGVQEDPSFPGCYEKLGELYRDGGNYAAAAAQYAAAIRLVPHDGTLYFQLASIQAQIHDIPAAAVSARRAAALLPDNADAQRLYGEVAEKIGNLSEALAALQRAHVLQPGSSEIIHRLVHLEVDTLNTDAAERDLTPWLAVHHDDAEACALMSAIYNQKPRTDANLKAGIDYAQRAITGLPHAPQAYLLLGNFLLDAKRPRDALQTYLAIARSQPGNEAVLQGLINSYNACSMPDKAAQTATRFAVVVVRHERINALKRVLNRNASNIKAGLELARLEEEEGNPDAARADYARLLHVTPHDAHVHAALAAFYRRAGLFGLAQQAKDPDYVEEAR